MLHRTRGGGVVPQTLVFAKPLNFCFGLRARGEKQFSSSLKGHDIILYVPKTVWQEVQTSDCLRRTRSCNVWSNHVFNTEIWLVSDVVVIMTIKRLKIKKRLKHKLKHTCKDHSFVKMKQKLKNSFFKASMKAANTVLGKFKGMIVFSLERATSGLTMV